VILGDVPRKIVEGGIILRGIIPCTTAVVYIIVYRVHTLANIAVCDLNDVIDVMLLQ
jgi:hypothetical protein